MAQDSKTPIVAFGTVRQTNALLMGDFNADNAVRF